MMTDLRKAAASLLSAVDLALPYAPHRHEWDHVADTADDLRAALAAEQAPDADAPRAEVEALRKFAQSVMEAWPMGGIDGGDLQGLAVDCGLLVPEQRFAPCHEELCSCAEYARPEEWAAGVECFRKTPLLTGSMGAAMTRAQMGE